MHYKKFKMFDSKIPFMKIFQMKMKFFFIYKFKDSRIQKKI
jgi:hypothetical protein